MLFKITIVIQNLSTGIDIEVSRLAIEFQKVCMIRLPHCTNTTLKFASRIAHQLAAYYSNSNFTSLVKPTS